MSYNYEQSSSVEFVTGNGSIIPPISVAVPHFCVAQLTNVTDQRLPAGIDAYRRNDFNGAINILATVPPKDPNIDYRLYYLRGVAKYALSKTYPTIYKTIPQIDRGICFCCDKKKMVTVPDNEATLAAKSILLNEALNDLTFTFYSTADLPNVNPKERSDISHAIAVVYKDYRNEPHTRAFVSMAVKLNPENMDARQAYEMMKRPVEIIDIQNLTRFQAHVSSSASASASASSSSAIIRTK
jgi:hypothetical protein